MISEIDLGQEADELALLVEARRRQSAKVVLRSRLLDVAVDRVRVAVRIHLLPLGIERELRAQLASLHDSIAVLRHCDPRLDARCIDMHEHACLMRERVAEQLDAFVCDVDVTVAGPPTHGEDWIASNVAPSTIRATGTTFAAMRRELVAAVDRIVDSELIRLLPTGTSMVDTELVECALVDFDSDSVERVRAFVEHVRDVAAQADHATQRLRIEALRRDGAHPATVQAESDARRQRARHDLDVLRALRAAVDEVELAHHDAHSVAQHRELTDPRA